MKTALALLCVLFTACSTVSDPASVKEVAVNLPATPRPAVKPVVDEQCANLSKTARSIAVVRDAGISQDDAPLMVKATNFPLSPMVREVYSRRDISPIVGATNSYAVCTNMGFAAMQAALTKADEEMAMAEMQRIKNELASKRTTKKSLKK